MVIRFWFGLVLAASVAQAQGASRRHHVWNVAGGIEAVDVPGRSDAFGTPVSIHAVRSRLPVERLAEDLVHQFERAKLYIAPAGAIQATSDLLQLTGLDPDTFIAYTIFFQENPDHTTTVILTEAYLAERRQTPNTVGFAPVMPRARELMTSENEGLELAHYRVRASPAEIDAFHQQALTRAGYHANEPGVWQKGDDLLRFSFKSGEDGEIEVLITHRKAPIADVSGSANGGH